MKKTTLLITLLFTIILFSQSKEIGILENSIITIDEGLLERQFTFTNNGHEVTNKLFEIKNDIYGRTDTGTSAGGGAFFKYNTEDKNFENIQEFSLSDIGFTPLYATDSYIYGRGYISWSFKYVFIRYDTETNLSTIIHYFDSSLSTDADIVSGMNNLNVLQNNETAYFDNLGKLYRFDLTNNTHELLYDLSTLETVPSIKEMIYHSNGNLYISTLNNIYEYDIEENIINEIITYSNRTNESNLVEGSNGNLYGLENNSSGIPRIKEIDINNKTTSYLHTIDNGILAYRKYINGDNLPALSVNGNILYGIYTNFSESVFFSFNLSTQNFQYSVIEEDIRQYVLIDDFMYGAGIVDYIYKYNTIDNEIEKVNDFSFGLTHGFSPNSLSQSISNANIFYGTTDHNDQLDVSFGDTLFSYNAETGEVNTLIQFDTYNSPRYAFDDNNGLVYTHTDFSTTFETKHKLFQYNPDNNESKIVIDYENMDETFGNIFKYFVFEEDLYMYATYKEDSDSEFKGAILKYDPQSENLSVLYESTDLNALYQIHLYPEDKKFYGSLQLGGAYGYGYFFSFDLETNELVNHYDFQSIHNANFTQDIEQENIYFAISHYGDEERGAIGKLEKSTNNVSIVYEFMGTDGFLSLQNPYQMYTSPSGVFYVMLAKLVTPAGDSIIRNILVRIDSFEGNSITAPYEVLESSDIDLSIEMLFTDDDKLIYKTNQELSIYNENTSASETYLDYSDYTSDTGSSTFIDLQNVFETDNTLSVDDIVLDDTEISIFPNPTSNYIQFNKEVEKVDIYTLGGKQISNLEIKDNKIDVKELKNGMYILKIQQGDKIQKNIKLIKK